MSMSMTTPSAPATEPATWRPKARLFGELQDLKRQRPAHLDAPLSTVLFRRAWRRLLAGADFGSVADATTAEALTNVLFPGCDEAFFPVVGLSAADTRALLREALATTAGDAVGPATMTRLRDATDALAERYSSASEPDAAPLPRSLDLLCRQPRAGATRPGIARLVLVPAEMHADHCLLTAVYAALAAEDFGADAGVAFVCGLAHHLHNALLPDCGFAGEILLGSHLAQVISVGRERALAELPVGLRQRVREALRHHETLSAPEGEAISAGDVLDRVLDVKWRTRAAAVTDADILDDLDLVHAGPLKEFQLGLLSAAGVWSRPPSR